MGVWVCILIHNALPRVSFQMNKTNYLFIYLICFYEFEIIIFSSSTVIVIGGVKLFEL